MRTRIAAAYKDAMRAKEQEKTATIRMIMAALKDKDIAARTTPGKEDGIAEPEILAMLQGMIKQRQESLALYEKGGRPELAAKEQAEIAVIKEFLPQALSSAEIAAAIEEAMAATQASSIKDMGKVMAALKEKYAGRMDFAEVSAQIKARL
jgi:uncharacterized protein YqeY